MEIRPRLPYSNEQEYNNWMLLLEKARVDGPKSLLFEYDGGEIIFDGPCRTAEDLMRFHKVDPRKYLARPMESTYWETAMKSPDGPITVQNHRLKIKVVPKPLEVEQFKEFAEGLPKYEIKETEGKIAHVIISDLHMGAVHKEYNLKKVVELLSETAAIVNSKNYKRVIVHCLGDVIESFTGLSHRDSWKSIEMWGVDLVKESSKILAHFLDQINNLSGFTLIGGNHDRVSDKIDDDKKSGAADMIAYILEIRGYPVKFHPLYIVDEYDDFCLILEHGHFGLSKQNPYEKIFRLGRQEKFNIIVHGHDHTRKTGRSPDGSNYRMLTCPAFIPSNPFGDELGREGTSGFMIIEGGRKPVVIDYTL